LIRSVREAFADAIRAKALEAGSSVREICIETVDLGVIAIPNATPKQLRTFAAILDCSM
jgi:hypothetical protein